MTPEEQHAQYVDGLVRLLMQRPLAGVIVLIRSNERGLEMSSSSPDFVFQMGILKAGAELIDNRFRMDMEASYKSGEVHKHEAAMEMELNVKPKGGVN